MNLNFIALWFAVIPAASLLWRSVRAGRRAIGWVIVSSLILLIALLGWFLFRDAAGFATVFFMLVFMLIPLRLNHAAMRASEAQRWGRGRVLAQLAAVLHPEPEWRILPRLFGAFELAHAGNLAEADARLQLLARGDSSIALTAEAQRLRMLGRWRELKSLAERQGLLTLRTHPGLSVLYLRALGELGYVDDLAKFARAQEHTFAATGSHDFGLLYLFAFSGQVELTRELVSSKSRSYSPETRDFWLAVALQSAGRPDEARRAFGQLRSSTDAQIRARAEQRFDNLAHAAPEEPPSAQTLAVVQHFARKLAESRRVAVGGPRAPAHSRVTLLLVGVNAFVYVLGSYPDFGETREEFLKRWEFVAPQILDGQWWRTLSYLFVHANALHLLMNLAGLWVLGPTVERAFGRVRYGLIYLAAGYAGSATYLGLALFRPSDVELVGASGCIMGLLGASVALTLRAWLKHRATVARDTLLRLLAVLAVQVVFDYTANHSGSGGPQIASLAHIMGALGGFSCALLLRDKLSGTPGQELAS